MSWRRSRPGRALDRSAEAVERHRHWGLRRSSDMPDLSELPDLTGRTILVTGATSGIGRAATLQLAAAGATVLAHGRSPEKAAELARSLGTEPLLADFARLAEVRALADRVLERTDRLDAILHNAGAFHRQRILTEDGHECTFQVNHLAPFLLQMLLNDLVVNAPDGRIVVTTSVTSRTGKVDLDDLDRANGRHRPFRTYATTKLMGILFVKELRRRLAGTTVTATAVHPGKVVTNFGAGSLLPRFVYRVPIRKYLLLGYFLCTPEQGAEPLVWLATREDPGREDGLYFDRFVPTNPPSPQAEAPNLARDLWLRSEQLVQRWIGPAGSGAG